MARHLPMTMKPVDFASLLDSLSEHSVQRLYVVSGWSGCTVGKRIRLSR